MPDLIKSTKQFVQYHLGKKAFAQFTGQDATAWGAFVHLADCYAHGGGELAITAMSCVLRLAQPKVWNVFVQAIPAILDWPAVAKIWPEIIRQTDFTSPIKLRYRDLAATERVHLAKEIRLRLHGLTKHGDIAGVSPTRTGDKR